MIRLFILINILAKKYDHYKWLDDRHKLGVSEVIGIIMNETYNCVRKKQL